MTHRKTHYSCAELAAFKLPGYQFSERAFRDLVARENWPFREVNGKGGKGGLRREYQPPKKVRELILEQLGEAALQRLKKEDNAHDRATDTDQSLPLKSETTQPPATPPEHKKALAQPAERGQFSKEQRMVADMRLVVLQEVEKLMEHKSLEWAIGRFRSMAQAGELNDSLARAAAIAHDRNNAEFDVVIGDFNLLTAKFPDGFALDQPTHCVIASRTIKRWRSDYREFGWAGLVPGRRQKDMTVKCWHALAFDLEKRPQGSCRKWVHAQILEQWDPKWPKDEAPSYDVVCTLIREKASQGDLLKGRWSGQQLRSKQYYTERTTDGLLPWDIIHSDGWTTHFTAPHPVTGEYVTYEVWDFHDVATGYVPPFGLGLSENFEVIMKGAENCVREGGRMALWQTDSTRIVKNSPKVKGDVVQALEHRIGTTLIHPQTVGNAQANGMPENFHAWMDKRCRELATYQGKAMDSMTHRRVKKITEKMVKAKNAGDLIQYDRLVKEAAKTGKGLVFQCREEACAWLEKQRRIWNTMPCRVHPKIRDPETGKLRHMSRLERLEQFKQNGWEPSWLGDKDSHETHLIDLFRPHVQVKVQRGVVKPYGGMRFRHADLDHWEGQDVVVAYDPWEWRSVIVKDLSGEVLCVADYCDATPHRAQTAIEAAQEKRALSQIKLRERQIAQIQARHPGLELEHGDGNIIEMKRVDLSVLHQEEEPLKRVEFVAAIEEPQRTYMDTVMELWGNKGEGPEAPEDEAAAR